MPESIMINQMILLEKRNEGTIDKNDDFASNSIRFFHNLFVGRKGEKRDRYDEILNG